MIRNIISFFKTDTTDRNQKIDCMRTNWVEVTDKDAIEKIIHRSNRIPQFIFKHSTRCPISSRAYSQISSVTDEISADVEINYVDVIAYRDVSQEIADKLGIEHESPQLLLVESNKVIWDVSHYDIEADDIIKKAKASVKALSV